MKSAVDGRSKLKQDHSAELSQMQKQLTDIKQINGLDSVIRLEAQNLSLEQQLYTADLDHKTAAQEMKDQITLLTSKLKKSKDGSEAFKRQLEVQVDELKTRLTDQMQ